MTGYGRASKVQVYVGFGMRLISILVQEYGAYFVTRVDIVNIESSKEKGRRK